MRQKKKRERKRTKKRGDKKLYEKKEGRIKIVLNKNQRIHLLVYYKLQVIILKKKIERRRVLRKYLIESSRMDVTGNHIKKL